MKIFLIFSCLALFCLSCKANKNKISRINQKELKDVLTEARYRFVKNDLEIKREIINAIKDSLSIKLIRRRVDSFILKKYTKVMLISSIELDRSFIGTGITVEYTKNIDSNKVPSFDSIAELRAFMIKLGSRQNKEIKLKVIKDSTQKDSLKVKKKKND